MESCITIFCTRTCSWTTENEDDRDLVVIKRRSLCSRRSLRLDLLSLVMRMGLIQVKGVSNLVKNTRHICYAITLVSGPVPLDDAVG